MAGLCEAGCCRVITLQGAASQASSLVPCCQAAGRRHCHSMPRSSVMQPAASRRRAGISSCTTRLGLRLYGLLRSWCGIAPAGAGAARRLEDES